MTNPIILDAQEGPFSLETQTYPGKTLGFAALILSVVGIAIAPLALVGLILGYLAKLRSKEVGLKNKYAHIAIIVGWIAVALAFVVAVILIILFFGFISLAVS